MKKQIAVLGLGVFGRTIALTLEEYGCEVIAIDMDLDIVESISNHVTYAVKADFTDIDQLNELDLSSCCAAVVASGTKLEESVLGVINLKEIGIPKVIAKVTNERFGQVLKKVGADILVQPEKEIGESIAKTLLTDEIIDIIDIDENYSIVEILAKRAFIGKSLEDLDFRNTYEVNVIAIKSGDILNVNLKPEYKIMAEDHLLVIAKTHDEKDMNKIRNLED